METKPIKDKNLKLSNQLHVLSFFVYNAAKYSADTLAVIMGKFNQKYPDYFREYNADFVSKYELPESYVKKNKSETPIYFLFGEDACRDWSENGIRGLRKAVRNDQYNPVTYESNGNVIEFAEAYTGWNDYVILTKEQFDKINDL